MRTLAILGLMAVVSGWTAAAQYHDPVYLAGGYNSATSTIYVRGVFKIDVNASTMSTFFTPRYYTYGFKMDADNENVVFATGDQFSTSTLYSGPEAGLYRYDPAAQKFSTLYHDTMTFYRPYKLLINQDGDYVFGSYTRNWTGTRTEYH